MTQAMASTVAPRIRSGALPLRTFRSAGRASAIYGVGAHAPSRVVTNAELEKVMETSDQWIQERTGIHRRHIADPGTRTLDLAKVAGEKALAAAGLTPADLDMIIVGTSSPDGPFPAIACQYEHARKRGARIWGEVVGYGASADMYHYVAPHPQGAGAARAMRKALQRAGIEPEQVGYVNAHGTSTKVGDIAETRAIKDVFGDHAYKLAVSSTKSVHAHLLGGAGAIELAATMLAVDRGLLPPTINLEDPDPECDLDYVPLKARKADVQYAISNSFGFGGHNATLVVRRPDPN